MPLIKELRLSAADTLFRRGSLLEMSENAFGGPQEHALSGRMETPPCVMTVSVSFARRFAVALGPIWLRNGSTGCEYLCVEAADRKQGSNKGIATAPD
jgi:hypothetical protein